MKKKLDNKNTTPLNHIAFIVDGNRRWARDQGKHPSYGHDVGCLETLPKIVEHCLSLKIPEASFWVFSTENWKRDINEVNHLMMLFTKLIPILESIALKYNARVKHLGRKDRLPTELLQLLDKVSNDTQRASGSVINICLDYGGRDEVIRAINKMLKSGFKGESVSEEALKNYMDTRLTHDLDLIIRTGGDQRTSGFMIWSGAYSELYFEKAYFPALTPEKVDLAIASYEQRKRRFGGN